MEREKQKTAEKKQPKESFELNQRRGDNNLDKLSPKQFIKFVSVTLTITMRLIKFSCLYPTN